VEGPSKRGLASRDSASRDLASPSRQRGEILQLTGRAMTDHIVVFDGTERLTGRTIRVHIEDASAFTLYGRVLTGEHAGDTAGFAYTPDAGPRTADSDEA